MSWSIIEYGEYWAHAHDADYAVARWGTIKHNTATDRLHVAEVAQLGPYADDLVILCRRGKAEGALIRRRELDRMPYERFNNTRTGSPARLSKFADSIRRAAGTPSARVAQ